MRTLAVDRREVDRLRTRPHLGCHFIHRYIEDDRRRLPMDVAAGSERLHESRILRKMRKQAKLDLRVVCSHQLPARSRDESAPDVAAKLPANRNVLKVGITRGKASRRSN